MKILSIIIISILCVLIFLGNWNANSAIISRGETEFSEVLKSGVDKAQIISFLNKKGYYYSDTSKENPSKYYKDDGKCHSWTDRDIKWNCEYFGYVFTRRDVGFLEITNPSLRIYFFYDENKKLVTYKMRVAHTFL